LSCRSNRDCLRSPCSCCLLGHVLAPPLARCEIWLAVSGLRQLPELCQHADCKARGDVNFSRYNAANSLHQFRATDAFQKVFAGARFKRCNEMNFGLRGRQQDDFSLGLRLFQFLQSRKASPLWGPTSRVIRSGRWVSASVNASAAAAPLSTCQEDPDDRQVKRHDLRLFQLRRIPRTQNPECRRNS
jgi:hypothetical protein